MRNYFLVLATIFAASSGSGFRAANIYFHDGTAGKLYQANIDGSSPTALLTYNGVITATALDSVSVDPVNDNLYYVRVFNDINRGLYKTTTSGASPTRISPNSANAVSGVSLDLVNNRLYLHDDTLGKWYRGNLDGSGMTVLQSIVASAAFSAVDTAHSAFYYTQTLNDGNRGLYKTDLAMNTLGTRISSSTDLITGIAVNPLTSTLYFHDSTAGQIISAALDGSSPQNLLALTGQPVHIALDLVNSRAYYYSPVNNSARGLYRTSSLTDFSSANRISASTDLVGPIGISTLLPPASVSSVSASSASGAYAAGSSISITITFDQAVAVTGTPRLQLNSGGSVFANYSSGSGTTTLTFSYVIGSGENSADLDYSSTSALSLNSGTIRNSGTDATLTLPSPGASGSLGANKSFVVDTTAPSIAISSPSADATRMSDVSYTVTATGASSFGLLANQVIVSVTGTAGYNSLAVIGSGAIRTVTLGDFYGTGTLGISLPAGLASDTAGNMSGVVGPSATFTVDNTPPGLSIGAPSSFLSTGTDVSFTVTYSGADTVSLGMGDITVNSTGNASALAGVSGSGSTRTVTLSGIAGDGTLGISIAPATAADAVGNQAPGAGPSTTFTVDTLPPSISISAPSASYSTGAAITYLITYTGAAGITLADGDITVNGTGSASALAAVSGVGNTRTITLSSISGEGTLGISVAAATAFDSAGNTAPAAGPSGTFTVDTINNPPTISGTVASQAVNDSATVAPFAAVIIDDSDVPAQTLTVTVTLDHPAQGVFSTLNGFTAGISGVYTFRGAATVATAALRGLVFDPADNRVPVGSTETTAFTIDVSDGQGGTQSDASTTVISTSMNDAPAAGIDTMFRFSGDGAKISRAELLANDADPDNDTLTISLPSSTSVNGATVAIEGSWVLYTSPSDDNDDSFSYTLTDSHGQSTTGTVQVHLQEDQSESAATLSIATDGNDVVLTFAGIPSLIYTVQYTASLISPVWRDLATVTAAVDGSITYRDIHPTPPRFYRTFIP